MNQELSRGTVYGISAAIVVILVAVIVWYFGIRGTGAMSNEDIKRAEMQAAVGNEQLRRNIGNTPGGPPAMGAGEANMGSGAH